MVKGVDMSVKSRFWEEYEKEKKELEKEQKAINRITNALQTDESKYTKEIDEALYILQNSIEKRIKAHENMDDMMIY